MRPSSRLAIGLLAGLAGCAAAEADKTWGAHTCPEAEQQGHLATVTWCGDEWRTWHAKGQAASAGTMSNGVFGPATQMWWPDGTVGAKLDETGTTMAIVDESQAPWGTQEWDREGMPLACPAQHESKQATLDSGHTKTWCEAKDKVSGRLTTRYASGSVESVQHWVAGQLHGPMTAYHPDGSVWIRGEYLAGKKHGPWHTWDKSGTVYQQAAEPEWADHSPGQHWLDAAGSSGR